ncbi:hypothetical protein AAIH46_08445 [Rhizobium sp. 0TCS1.26]|uniref:hypothetical protein n=1 Tax=Rhizobium sp. 0TCS1.26 TaxID=3142623 RepID=UPI003D290080
MIFSSTSSKVLSSEDLEEIERFHSAWCEENGVEKSDERALEVASALIDWYSADTRYRSSSNQAPALPVSEKIKALLLQIT